MQIKLRGRNTWGSFTSAQEADAWADTQSVKCFQIYVNQKKIAILRRTKPPAYTSGGEPFVPFIPSWMDGPVVSSVEKALIVNKD